jgi:hypothetical protein
LARASLLVQARGHRRSARHRILHSAISRTADQPSASGDTATWSPPERKAGSPRGQLNRAAQTKNTAEGWRVFEAHVAGSGPPFDLATYNTLLDLLVDRHKEFRIVLRHMARSGVEPNEATLTLQVRTLLAEGDLDAAADIVGDAPRLGITPKRRLYAGLLDKLSTAGRLAAAAQTTVAMHENGLVPGEEQLVSLAEMCARASARAALADLAQSAGRKRERRANTAGASPASSASKSGAATWAAEAGRRLVSSPSSWLALLLDSVVAEHDTLSRSSFDRLSRALRGTPGWSVHEASIGPSDGVCSGCGASLCAPPLSAEQRHTLRDALIQAAGARSAAQADRLRAFAEWVASRQYSYVIDGANVAYRLQVRSFCPAPGFALVRWGLVGAALYWALGAGLWGAACRAAGRALLSGLHSAYLGNQPVLQSGSNRIKRPSIFELTEPPASPPASPRHQPSVNSPHPPGQPQRQSSPIAPV